MNTETSEPRRFEHLSRYHTLYSYDEISNYRSVTVLNTGCKIYTMMLNDRLKEEIEGKRILLKIQTGFRKNKSTIDNI
ncbi:hypothetical protein HZH66_007234 [Vespula vulgaris]|uniref:Reverse transcriptase domain-containing protein n=1 Tax=Vespula vulgaris TaxID=7454 RepID=A0A834JZ85_VESVU|nr:hypothetical protein HZH66_007234 [Vespula vulgaris]